MRKPSPKRPSNPAPAKIRTHPICAIYTKFSPGDDRTDSKLCVNFDALPLGKMRTMASSMLGLSAETKDWSAVRGPLTLHFRDIISSALCKDVQYDPTSFVIEFVVPTRALDDIRNVIIKHLSDYGIHAIAFK